MLSVKRRRISFYDSFYHLKCFSGIACQTPARNAYKLIKDSGLRDGRLNSRKFQRKGDIGLRLEQLFYLYVYFNLDGRNK